MPGPWVEGLCRAREQLLARESVLFLELTDVSSIDTDGMALCLGSESET